MHLNKNKLINENKLISGFTTKSHTINDVLNTLSDNVIWANMEQTHSNLVLNVDNVQLDKRNCHFPIVDATITSKPNIFLAARSADCLPILIYHPKKIIGAIHSGRVGTQNQLLLKTLELIKKDFDVSDQFKIYFGPAICVDCYEIDKEKKRHFDLVLENKKQLNHFFSNRNYELIESNLCTFEEETHFPSYRREGDLAGRMFTYIMMN